MAKTKILIVDDHRENITSLSHLIDADDIEIHSSQDAEGALDLLTSHDFALALLDVQMPGVSGFELARLIRGVKRFRDLPVIFVTAHQRDQSVIFEGYEAGAVDLLFKPLDPHVVRTKVRAFVKLDQQSQIVHAQVEELKRLRTEAESANLAKSRFLANMSHEIRTPLAAVMGFSEVLSQSNFTPEEKSECVSAIRRNGEILLRLIDDILDLSKIEAQAVSLENIEFSMDDLLKDIVSTLSLKAEEKGLFLRFENSSELDKSYISDPTRIKQVLLNIIGNAIKFTEKGGVEVTVRAEPSGPHAQDLVKTTFVVRDHGIGLLPEEASRLFQSFSQADASTRRQFGGTGLGLVISRQIARLMGGDLRLVSSVRGEGSVFEISFAIQKAKEVTGDRHADRVERSSSALGDSALDFSSSSVLVVDDSADNLMLVDLYLKPTKAKLMNASSGQEAIRLTAAHNPDLILMDVQMPGMDGHEATRAIRAAGYTGYVVGLTAHAMREQHEKCIESGYDFVLTKPINRQALLLSLQKIFASEKTGPKLALN